MKTVSAQTDVACPLPAAQQHVTCL